MDSNQRVFELFERVLDGADVQSSCRLNPEIKSEKGKLVFTLSGLYSALFNERELDFKLFQQNLYQGDLNARLAALNARVEPYQSTGKVATSWYCLSHISPETRQ